MKLFNKNVLRAVATVCAAAMLTGCGASAGSGSTTTAASAAETAAETSVLAESTQASAENIEQMEGTAQEEPSASAATSAETTAVADEKGTHMVTDHGGNEVEVPNKITRVVIDQIPILSTYMSYFQGSAPYIVGYCGSFKSVISETVLKSIAPELMESQDTVYAPSDLNIEEIIKLKPDVILYNANNASHAEILKSSGTCVGAILAIILSCSMIQTQLIALIFGLASVCFTLKVAGKNDGRSMVYLVLAGTIASSLFNAIGSLLKYTADPQDKLPGITYWLMGSFTSASYKKILIGSPLIISGVVVIFLLRWRLNILSLSDDEAKASGINIKQTCMIFILAATLITASSVSMCGQVGWIGLLIPHCARMMVGSNNRYVVPVIQSLGAGFMILIDTLSRTISIIELPLSILTAIIGAPVFISLLNKTRSALR